LINIRSESSSLSRDIVTIIEASRKKHIKNNSNMNSNKYNALKLDDGGSGGSGSNSDTEAKDSSPSINLPIKENSPNINNNNNTNNNNTPPTSGGVGGSVWPTRTTPDQANLSHIHSEMVEGSPSSDSLTPHLSRIAPKLGETQPGPNEHQLQYAFSFWFSKRSPGRQQSPQNYEQSIRYVGSFASVEQFWHLYSHMVRPNDLNGHCDIHLFKESIKPMWEDDKNKMGGRWIVRLRKGLASRCWENMILAMMGEQFMVGEEICGAVVSVRHQEDIVSIWNQNSNDAQSRQRIRDTLTRVLNLPRDTVMEYKCHRDSIQDKSSFRNTDVFLR